MSRSTSPKVSRRNVLKTLGFGGAAGALLGTYTSDCAGWLSVERKDLRLPQWSADGFKLALIADLHMNSADEMARAKRALEIALGEKPDLLVIGGDFVNYSSRPIVAHIAEALEPLHEATCPTVAVMGNHDYWCAVPQHVIEAVRKTPAKLLRNEIFDLGGVSIVGVDDATEGHQDFTFFPKGRVSRNCLAVLHEPDFVTEMPSHVSLQVSGHTHGGQVCLPFGVALHTPRGGRRYISGFFPEAKVPLYVTRGVGTVGIDFRLFCRPEVSILTLRSA